MDFRVKKNAKKNAHKYKKDDLDLALDFSKLAYKEFETFLKGIILFGSNVKKSEKAHDIDLLIILDDIGVELTKELIEAYNIVCGRIIKQTSKKIHITTIKFTTFWNQIKNSDPIAINILRDGVALIDTGFFDPLQALLITGQIKPTYESMWTYYNRSHETLQNIRNHMFDAIIGLYWSVMDAAHAALMKNGVIPPSPEHVSESMQKKMLPTKQCTKRDIETVQLFYGLYKEITHKTIQDISGQEFERYYGRAKDFVSKMKKVIEK
ncbi:MAG: hypothetical protein ACMXYK_01600 [Candidatus Woesearchaeota archaeon]